MENALPLLSVLIAAYNCAESVVSTVESVLVEREVPLEVIVVDDASTDTTPKVLDWLAERDTRVRVIHRDENGGEGPCRQTGLEAVRGQWLILLDADDLMIKGSLSALAERLRSTVADVVITSHYRYDVGFRNTRKITFWLKAALVKEGEPFDPATLADYLFSMTGSAICNKVFRMEHVRTHELRFQETPRIGDVYFTLSALAAANVVEYVDVPYYLYRLNHGDSLLTTGSSFPLTFTDACYALQDYLVAHGLWETWKTGYHNWVIANVPFNLSMMGTNEACWILARELHEHGFDRMGFDNYDEQACPHPKRYYVCKTLWTEGVEEGLFALMKLKYSDATNSAAKVVSTQESLKAARAQVKEKDAVIKRLRGEIDDLNACLAERDRELEDTWNSLSMRVGRAITSLPRALRDRLRRPRGEAVVEPEAPVEVAEEAPATEMVPLLVETECPLVSVIVAAMAPEGLKRTLDSIVAQDCSCFELLVVDGSGTDRVQAISKHYVDAYGFVRIVPAPSSPADRTACLLQGVKEARGSWIAIVDAGDYVYPEFLGALVGDAVGSEAEIVACGVRSFDKKPPLFVEPLRKGLVVCEECAFDSLESEDATGTLCTTKAKLLTLEVAKQLICVNGGVDGNEALRTLLAGDARVALSGQVLYATPAMYSHA